MKTRKHRCKRLDFDRDRPEAKQVRRTSTFVDSILEVDPRTERLTNVERNGPDYSLNGC